jgi:CubicO group peptidase (beta-lactamase class C family)
MSGPYYEDMNSLPSSRRDSVLFLSAMSCLVVTLGAVILQLTATPALGDGPVVSLSQIDMIVGKGIAEGQMPGAVVVVGGSPGVLYRKAYGQRQVEPTPEPMSVDTVFDIASLTKPVATATSVMLLAEQKKIDIHAPLVQYLPEFGKHGKEVITISQLLSHTSGLIADNHLRDYSEGKDVAWEKICGLKLVAPPGEKFIYSDVGFIALGVLVEKISGKDLNEFTRQSIFAPLEMNDTGYLPPASLMPRIAPANRQGEKWIRGSVHDPRASGMGGIAGHAGVFSTADDLSRYATMILREGSSSKTRVMQPETVRLMGESRSVPGGGIRTWGWDRQTGFSSNRGRGMTDRAMGHGGFTGTGLWIDPGLDIYVIFLSNRLHPDGKGAVNRLIGEIGTIAVQAKASGNATTGSN